MPDGCQEPAGAVSPATGAALHRQSLPGSSVSRLREDHLYCRLGPTAGTRLPWVGALGIGAGPAGAPGAGGARGSAASRPLPTAGGHLPCGGALRAAPAIQPRRRSGLPGWPLSPASQHQPRRPHPPRNQSHCSPGQSSAAHTSGLPATGSAGAADASRHVALGGQRRRAHFLPAAPPPA